MASRSVLVLGATGMLGSAIVRRLASRRHDWQVAAASRAEAPIRFDAEGDAGALERILGAARYDFVINCVGVLKSAIDPENEADVIRAIRVNALFPHVLASLTAVVQSRVIHVSTDAVFSGRREGAYTETMSADPTDLYGMTKSLGESHAPHVLNVRCSIVGRDRRRRGLVEWYLGSPADTGVSGFTDYVWTPATTLQVADLCEALVEHRFDPVRTAGPVYHFAPNRPLSKAAFLECLREVAGGAPVTRQPSPAGPCSRVLASSHPVAVTPAASDLRAAISEVLAEFSSAPL